MIANLTIAERHVNVKYDDTVDFVVSTFVSN